MVEVCRDGKPKLIANAQTRAESFTREGTCTDFYPNGKRKSIMVYKNDQPVGDVIKYYPNGQLYISEELDQNNRLLLMECHDSTGVVLAKNGNGKWITFDERFKEIESGPVINGLEDGEWHGTLNDTAKYVCSYTAGNLISGVNYYREKKVYTAVDVAPDFKGGIAAFYNFLGRAIYYPAVDREHHITGKVFVTFVVERDGLLTDVKIVKGVSKTLDEETLRVIKLSPKWIPGSQHGVAVRVKYTVPVNYTLSGDN